MISIRPLQATDDLRHFYSGNEDLDRFFKKYAAKNQYHLHIGATYVAVEDDRIVGFVTVAPGSIQADELPLSRAKGLPSYPLPVLRLARLAIERSRQRKGVGSSLVRFVLLRALELDHELGCLGVVVDPKAESVEFYTKLGFSPLDVIEGASRGPQAPVPHFLHIDLIRASLPPGKKSE
jgi:GNAT superfamily N-acetyltransferase